MEKPSNKQEEYDVVARQLEILAAVISGKQIEQKPGQSKELNQMTSEVLQFLKHLV
jgi:hypothetical protein